MHCLNYVDFTARAAFVGALCRSQSRIRLRLMLFVPLCLRASSNEVNRPKLLLLARTLGRRLDAMLFLLLQHSAHMKNRRKLTTPAPQEKLISAPSVLSPDNARPLTLSLCQLVNSSADVNKQQACLTP